MTAMIHKPPAREPACIHSGRNPQPASLCTVCKNGNTLAKWREDWRAWIQANPDSREAHYLDDVS